MGSANKTIWDACLKNQIAVSHTHCFSFFFFFKVWFLLYSQSCATTLLILDYVHHPQKKPRVHEHPIPIPPFPMAPLATTNLLPISMDSPILGRWGAWGAGGCLGSAEVLLAWTQLQSGGISLMTEEAEPQGKDCPRARWLEFITLRGEEVPLIIMQGHGA